MKWRCAAQAPQRAMAAVRTRAPTTPVPPLLPPAAPAPGLQHLPERRLRGQLAEGQMPAAVQRHFQGARSTRAVDCPASSRSDLTSSGRCAASQARYTSLLSACRTWTHPALPTWTRCCRAATRGRSPPRTRRTCEAPCYLRALTIFAARWHARLLVLPKTSWPIRDMCGACSPPLTTRPNIPPAATSATCSSAPPKNAALCWTVRPGRRHAEPAACGAAAVGCMRPSRPSQLPACADSERPSPSLSTPPCLAAVLRLLPLFQLPYLNLDGTAVVGAGSAPPSGSSVNVGAVVAGVVLGNGALVPACASQKHHARCATGVSPGYLVPPAWLPSPTPCCCSRDCGDCGRLCVDAPPPPPRAHGGSAAQGSGDGPPTPAPAPPPAPRVCAGPRRR